MKRGCRHRARINQHWRNVYVIEDGIQKHRLMYYDTCDRCGTWLPLDPANDAPPEVAIEVRAAEIAASWDEFTAYWHGMESLGSVSPNAEHLEILDRSIEQADTALHRRDRAEYLAGYLAHAIAHHDVEQRAGQAFTGGVGTEGV